MKLKLKGVEEEEISAGSVLCDLKDFCQVAKIFDAQVVILECPSIICPGFNSVLHIHAATAEVQLTVIRIKIFEFFHKGLKWETQSFDEF